MNLSLPDVTLVAIDGVALDLTRRALEECVRRVDFAEVLVFTDDPEFLVPDDGDGDGEPWFGECAVEGEPWFKPPSGAPIQRVVVTPPLRGWEAVNRVWWYEVPRHVHTSHFLTVQWDSWVLNPEAWDPDWLQYDYIGAPWPWHQIYRVGNGGFSLRSQKLHAHLVNSRLRYPLAHPEDDALCRRYRPMLEAEGFRWAPESVASRFSFERGPAGPTFGFHGAFNFPDVLNSADLDGRIAAANDYAMSKIEWAEMLQKRWEQYAAPAPHRDLLPARRARDAGP